ncbi:hypothetical protein BDW68DRAFT_153695 [Aspergillus falconensis]
MGEEKSRGPEVDRIIVERPSVIVAPSLLGLCLSSPAFDLSSSTPQNTVSSPRSVSIYDA